MTRRTYKIAFKKEVLAYINAGRTAYSAAVYFGNRDRCTYDASMIYQWKKNEEKILNDKLKVSRNRVRGAGRKPVLQDLEEALAD